MASVMRYPEPGMYPAVPPSMMGVPQGPGTLPPGYGRTPQAVNQQMAGAYGASQNPMAAVSGAMGPASPYTTGTYAPQPSQTPQVTQAPQGSQPAPQPPPMQAYQPPANSYQSTPTGYSGVPVVVSGQPSGAAGGVNNAMNALYGMGTGPVDTSALNSTNAALQKQMQYDMANAASYGASAAFGQGGAGTPVQMLASQQAANAMIPINAQMQQANLSFYNQQSANQLAALQSSGQLGLGQQGQDLNSQVAQQNALFGANTQNLATQNQAFNQRMMTQQQAVNMYNQMYNMGAGASGMDQANLDAMYQMYGTTDPNQIMAMLMGQVPMQASQSQQFNPFAAVGPAMMGYGMAGGFNPQEQYSPVSISYPGTTEMPGR